tara:strand:+ start:677 stop:1039 length:363 start_codon:yes stop_codon:yes gene_type:complete
VRVVASKKGETMDNSIEMQVLTTGADVNSAQQIILTNFYAWELRVAQPLGATTFYISPCNPAQDASNQWSILLGNPASWSAGAYTLLTDQGTRWPTGHAEIWVWSDAPQEIVVWGVKKGA